MTENRIYTVATSHLDTVWRWELPKTIEVFIPDTIEKNLELIKRYPHYIFNFEGSFRYELIEEYYPEQFKEIQEYAKQGRWSPSGSAYENGDVNIPSPEAILRNFLYGNRYFKEKLGRATKDVFLPDCFGFGYALPSIAKHAHLKGFTTQKLDWGSAVERPFDIGLWQGVDGAKIYASLNPLSYRNNFDGTVRGNVQVIDHIANNGLKYNLPWVNCFYGTGDWGGAPNEKSVMSVAQSIEKNENNNNTKVIAATSDMVFEDVNALAKKEPVTLPLYDGELLMRSHGAGSYTSRTMSKRLNSQCEILADYTEKACVTANLLTSYAYPKNVIDSAWKKTIQHQFHDDITGTSTMLVYNDSWNDYYAAIMQFKSEYEGASGAIANELDTSWCKECAVIVNNPVAIKRKDAVEAKVKLIHNANYIKVVDKNGKEVPSQVIKKNGKELDIVFLADVASVGYKVYDVQASDKPYNKKTDLEVTLHTLENDKYKLTFNKNGDIASIIDKKVKVQLLSAPIKLALLHNLGGLDYPSWEMRKEDVDSKPYAYANTPEFEIIENGPARIAVKVKRHAESSYIEQVVSMTSKGETIRVENFIDWQERRTLLKAQFPFTCESDEATYDLGLGAIKRGCNADNLYEVPAQKWADITDEYSRYGVSVLSDCKYGWDRPERNTLRLTCIHTPTGAFTKDARQDLQDIGRNIFAFGIFSHKGNIPSATQSEAEMLTKKLTAFQTTSRREGVLGDSFSLLKLSSKSVIVRAVKRAEDDEDIIIRVNEGLGKEQKNVKLSMFGEISAAEEVYASEEHRRSAKVNGGDLVFTLKPYEIKSFKVKVKCEKNKAKENFKKLPVEYNSTGITKDSYKVNCILQGSGCSLPDELIPETLRVKGLNFKMPDADMDKNVLITRGQVIDIPKGMTKVYILAASVTNDQEAEFIADKKVRKVTVHSMRERIGKWDMAGLSQEAEVKDVNIGIEFTHLHHPEGNLAAQKAYFFIYEIDVRNAKTLTLPDNNKIVILAMTAVKKFSSTVLKTSMVDIPEKNYKFGEIPPIDAILDKADFITIRAGKIQDQVKTGRGKGIKRDNLITNIIRSYTKSEW